MNIHRLPPTLAIRHARGFTLIELMIAIVVSSIVVVGVFAFSQIQQSTASLHERDVRIQQSLEGAMWSAGRDIRSAGLGFTRLCTELRVWSDQQQQLINPGGVGNPNNAFRDPVTDEAYWVLRDGLQAHWNSSGAASWDANEGSSSYPGSAADSFDVILGEPGYVQSHGVFTLVEPIDDGDTKVIVQTNAATLDPSVPEHVAAVQQLFPPGTFFVVAAPVTGLAFDVTKQSQCALLQVTGDVTGNGGNWDIPIATLSGFNKDLDELLNQNQNGDAPLEAPADFDVDDWEPGSVNVAGASIMPMGRLRWSRYEIDYTIPELPYLVRRDIIGYQDGVDPGNLGTAVDYPWCQSGQCPAPQLHIPDSQSPPTAVAIGPLVEDMQVAVGCDGYSANAANQKNGTEFLFPPPDTAPQDFGEKGPNSGPLANLPNALVDENPPGANDDQDEWLGNAENESWAPDCVWYGTAQYFAAGWGGVESDVNPPGNFRMSPQTIRVTLIGTAEVEAAVGGTANNRVAAVEDRAAMDSIIPGRRERFVLTERFSPANLRWRDPYVE